MTRPEIDVRQAELYTVAMCDTALMGKACDVEQGFAWHTPREGALTPEAVALNQSRSRSKQTSHGRGRESGGPAADDRHVEVVCLHLSIIPRPVLCAASQTLRWLPRQNMVLSMGEHICWIRTVPPADSEGGLELAYRTISERGDVAHILQVQSLDAKALDLHYSLYRHLMFGRSPLSRAEREMIAVVVSRVNRCKY